MLRAVDAKVPLCELENLPALLEIATISHSPKIENIVGSIVEQDAHVAAFEAEIDERVFELGVLYIGELPEGESEEMAISSAPGITGWTDISANEHAFGMIVEFDIDIIAQINFEERSLASYDKEDDVCMGAERAHTEVEDSVTLRMFV